MPERKHHLSGEGFEQLHTWVLAHVPEALDDPDFLPGLVVIIELEAERVMRQHCWKALQILTEPGHQ